MKYLIAVYAGKHRFVEAPSEAEAIEIAEAFIHGYQWDLRITATEVPTLSEEETEKKRIAEETRKKKSAAYLQKRLNKIDLNADIFTAMVIDGLKPKDVAKKFNIRKTRPQEGFWNFLWQFRHRFKLASYYDHYQYTPLEEKDERGLMFKVEAINSITTVIERLREDEGKNKLIKMINEVREHKKEVLLRR